MRRVPVAPLALLAVTLVLPLTLSPARAAQTWERTFDVTGTPNLSIHTNDGTVRITTVPGRQVGVRIATRGWTVGSHGVNVDARQDGDHIDVTARVPRWGGISFSINRSLLIEVTCPERADIDVDTGDGGVTISRHDGTIKVHTGDGSISADGLHGDLTLTSGDGAITGINLDGRLRAHSGDGHVRLDGRFEALEVTTGDGGIDLDAAPGSRLADDWYVRTGDGGVSVRLPRDLKARLDAHTGDGGITLDLPVEISGQISRSSVTGNLNGGGRPFVLRTGDGPIRIASR
jgi:hypothetical protein